MRELLFYYPNKYFIEIENIRYTGKTVSLVVPIQWEYLGGR